MVLRQFDNNKTHHYSFLKLTEGVLKVFRQQKNTKKNFSFKLNIQRISPTAGSLKTTGQWTLLFLFCAREFASTVYFFYLPRYYFSVILHTLFLSYFFTLSLFLFSLFSFSYSFSLSQHSSRFCRIFLLNLTDRPRCKYNYTQTIQYFI